MLMASCVRLLVLKVVIQEAVHLVKAAFAKYRQNNNIASDTDFSAITPYLNYVQIRTTGIIDGRRDQISKTCSTMSPCYKLPNGSVLWVYSGDQAGWGNSFGGTTGNRYIYIVIDPDNTQISTAPSDNPSKSVEFALYADGKIRLHSYCTTNHRTYHRPSDTPAGDVAWCPGTPSIADPSWFNWN